METPECCDILMTKGLRNWHCFCCGNELPEQECPHCRENFVEFHMCRDIQENYD